MADDKPTSRPGDPLETGWSNPPAPATNAQPAAAEAGPEAVPVPPPLDFGALTPSAEPVAPTPNPAHTAALFPSEPPPRAQPVGPTPAPRRAAARAESPPRRLFDIFGDTVALGKTGVPLSFVVGGAAVVVAVASGVLGLSLGIGLSSAGQYADSLPTAESGSARASDSGSAPPATSSPVRTLSERVASGEPAALAELELNAGKALKADQAVLLALGKAAAVARQAHELRTRLDADPTLIEKPEVVAHLREFAGSDLTSVEALAAMARLPGPISADLLYEVWTSTSDRTPTTELAERLVYSEDVLPKASPALKVALDLRHADESNPCDGTLALVRTAAESGDRRVLPMLAKLGRKFGCGPRKKDDCFPCLREGEDLKRAITESRKRPVPKH